MQRIVTRDETWCFEYDPEGRQRSLQCKKMTSSLPKNAHVSKSRMKTLLITFFDIKDIVHSEFFPQSQTVNQAYYLEILTMLQPTRCSLSSSLWPKNRLLKLNPHSAPWFSSKLLLVIYKNKVCLKGTKIPGYWEQLKKYDSMTILITFLDIMLIVLFGFILHGQIVTQAYYMEIFKWLLEAVHRKRPELRFKDWILHHDSAPRHKALCQQFLAQ
jgi:ABC-type phosphate/phosphonate transport system permease subunit